MESHQSCGGRTPDLSRRPPYTSSSRPRAHRVADRRAPTTTVDVVKGPSGFGFTLADTEHGQYRAATNLTSPHLI